VAQTNDRHHDVATARPDRCRTSAATARQRVVVACSCRRRGTTAVEHPPRVLAGATAPIRVNGAAPLMVGRGDVGVRSLATYVPRL
jgi:hypothetical protein